MWGAPQYRRCAKSNRMRRRTRCRESAFPLTSSGEWWVETEIIEKATTAHGYCEHTFASPTPVPSPCTMPLVPSCPANGSCNNKMSIRLCRRKICIHAISYQEKKLPHVLHLIVDSTVFSAGWRKCLPDSVSMSWRSKPRSDYEERMEWPRSIVDSTCIEETFRIRVTKTRIDRGYQQ